MLHLDYSFSGRTLRPGGTTRLYDGAAVYGGSVPMARVLIC